MSKRVVAAIPARYASTRLPGKALREIHGVSLIERVVRQVERARRVEEITVLTDDERIFDAVTGFGAACLMTPEAMASGTDRIAFAAKNWSADVILNVQGDEPLIDPKALDLLAEHLASHPDDQVGTLAAPASAEDGDDPDIVKVVTDRNGYGLYFSRARIPYPRKPEHVGLHRHIGVYGYQRAALLEIAAVAPSPLELCESLEQLRMLESGFRIKVLPVACAWPGVDTIKDLREVEQLLVERGDPLATD